MIGGLLALLASGLLGISDFLGGAISRKTKLVTVLLVSQIVATLAIIPRMMFEDPTVNAGPALLWG